MLRKSSQNEINLDEAKKIWVPRVTFFNTQLQKLNEINERTIFTVSRRTDPLPQILQKPQNTYTYDGAKNPIDYLHIYSEKFTCDYDLALYPFDKQSCRVILALTEQDREVSRLIPKEIKYVGPVDLLQYYVIKTVSETATLFPNIRVVEVSIIFGRRILNVMLSSYLPTLMTCLISLATYYFDARYFEASVCVNVTAMLALTTMYVGITDALPRTSYIKMIDIWLVFCLSVPFFEVILQVSTYATLSVLMFCTYD